MSVTQESLNNGLQFDLKPLRVSKRRMDKKRKKNYNRILYTICMGCNTIHDPIYLEYSSASKLTEKQGNLSILQRDTTLSAVMA